MKPRLSKSRLLSAAQCDLRLWYDVFGRDLASARDAAGEALFATGHEVGALARQRFPGGVLVSGDGSQVREAQQRTGELIAHKDTQCLYEAAFEHDGVAVRVDVLVRVPASEHAASTHDCWDLIEVKSSTRVKAVHDLDLAIQVWVLRGAGVDLRRVGVLTLDRSYLWPGGDYDLYALFALHDRTSAVRELLADVGTQVARSHALLAAAQRPHIAPGAHCTTPHTCPFLAHCTRDQVVPEWPLNSLPALQAKRRTALEAAGIADVRDIGDAVELKPLQEIARRAIIDGEAIVHGDLGAALGTAEYPVHHLDFETAAPAIPRYVNTCAYDTVPFQFSVHTEHADGRVEHHEFLHLQRDDPRKPLAMALLDALGSRGSVVVYTDFERRVINRLAMWLPHLATGLRGLIPRLWDLHPLLRDNFYHRDFRGSFSLKSVLPALCPELAYDDLEIADGQLAALRWLQAIDSDDAAQREAIFKALRAYCGRDTFALLRIRKALAAIDADRKRGEVDCGDGG